MRRSAFVMLAAAAATVAASGADPFAAGTHEVATASGKMPSDIKWTYNVWAPDAAGSFPVIVFVSGGGGVAPGTSYSTVAGSIAAKGVVFVALSRTAAPAPNKDAALLGAAIPWLQQNLPGAGLKAAADWDKLALSGHSAGNHVFCSYLQSECGIAKAAVMIDPVDGYDPFGIEKIFCITPGEKTNFTTPALLLRTGLDPVVKVMVACAPDKLANQRFYDAWAGPVWEVNATGYGHLDVNNDGIEKMGGAICATDKLPKDPYHAQIAGLTSAFLRMVFDGDGAAEQVLVGADAMPVASVANYAYNGQVAPFTAQCTHG